MTWIWSVVVIGVLGAVVVPILFWVFVVFAARRYFSVYQQAAAQEQRLLSELLQAGGAASPQLQQQFLAAAAQAQRSMSHLGDIQCERAELRQAELKGMAAQAGIQATDFY